MQFGDKFFTPTDRQMFKSSWMQIEKKTKNRDAMKREWRFKSLLHWTLTEIYTNEKNSRDRVARDSFITRLSITIQEEGKSTPQTIPNNDRKPTFHGKKSVCSSQVILMTFYIYLNLVQTL